MGKFMVWAVCKPDGNPVAYVQWSGRGQYKAQRLAEGLTACNPGLAGRFFVRQMKVDREAQLVHTELA